MYTLILQGVCILLWIVFIVLWLRSAGINEQKRAGTVIIPVPLLVLAFFIVSFLFPFAWAFLPVTAAGMLVLIFGFLWTQWAKSVLASGWSSGNVITTSHEITREMPYSLVRHPFYLGVVIMFAGTALVFGNLTMVAATVAAALLLMFNALMEEHALREEFGQDFNEYQEEVPFFIPRLIGSFTKAFSRREDDDL